MALTTAERLALTKVLDYQVSQTRKRTPRLLPLSLYSSELKGREQIAGSLNNIRAGKPLSNNSISRERYFNSLSNQGLAEGSAAAPKLTALSKHYLDPYDVPVEKAFWQGDGGDKIEVEIVRDLAKKLASGETVADAFKIAWYGAQTFFDYVPESEVPNVLADREQLWLLFRLNSNGWEIGRYFQLSVAERKEFEAAFEKVSATGTSKTLDPIELAAGKYKEAAQSIQKDVRFRISGFLKAYDQLRSQLGADLPRLDRKLVVRVGAKGGAGTPSAPLVDQAEDETKLLQHPHQLIVTGCPGSGKSYYIDKIAAEADFLVRTQFHPESSFFDFVGAYKPQPLYEQYDEGNPLLEGDGSVGKRGRPLIDYRFVPGPFIRGLTRALLNPGENVVVLIEELNRGNAAAILGDVLQLLDRGEDGSSRYEIEATAEQRAYFASVGVPIEAIKLPANFYIWATMNSADQGVFPLDTAFRRRWSYVYKGYTEPCQYPIELATILYGGVRYSWDSFRNAVNDHLIQHGIHEDKLIGPYFLTVSQLSDPGEILQKLFLYLWDDVLRFRQDSLFASKSFSGVITAWSAGAGAPLNMEMPAPIPEVKEGEIPLQLGTLEAADNIDASTASSDL